MGLGGENGRVVVESWDVCKSKGRKKKKDKDNEGVVEEEETGCWVRLRFIGSCISSRAKVDSSVSGTGTHYGHFSLSSTKQAVREIKSPPVEEFYRSRGKLLDINLAGGIPESWPKLLYALNLDDYEDRHTAAA